MSKQVSGATVRVWLNGNIFPEISSISWNISYGEEEIIGIDSGFPQEIASNRILVSGSISGMRLKFSGGLQAKNAIAPIIDILKSPYISIRIEDRSTGETLLSVPEAKVIDQSAQTAAKGILSYSFRFKGMVPYETNDIQ